jgi:ferredoxin
MMRLTVDREVCAGLGECEAIAPSIFEVQDDAISKVLVDDVGPEDLEMARRAVMSCPTGALTLGD